MKRSKPPRASVEQARAWQRRSQDNALARLTARPRRAMRRARRRNDGPWRREVLELRGPQCRIPGCGRMTDVQIDHLIPRSQGGPSVLANGWPLCREHHEMKTRHELLIDPAWLGPDQVEWLADQGHAEWLLDGVVVGRHRRLFTDGPDRRSAS